MTNGAQPLEAQIADRINASSLGIKVKDPVNGPEQGVYIDNPYDAINADRDNRFGKHPKGTRPDRVYGPDLLLPDLDDKRRWGWASWAVSRLSRTGSKCISIGEPTEQRTNLS